MTKVEDGGNILKLTDRQKERIEAIREEITEGGRLPKPTVEVTINSLLDTWDAVNNGLYTEDHTPNGELRELVEEWRSYGFTLDTAGTARAEMIGRCADELEAAIEE